MEGEKESDLLFVGEETLGNKSREELFKEMLTFT